MLKRLAAMAVALGAGLSSPATAELAAIPEDMLEALIEPEELASIDETDRERLVTLLALDPRPSVRSRAAVSLQFLSPRLTAHMERLLERLAADPAEGVRHVLGGILGSMLARMPALDRSFLLCSWSTSSSEHERYVMASALGWPFEAVGVQAALHTLADDASAEVRAAARRSSRRRALLGV